MQARTFRCAAAALAVLAVFAIAAAHTIPSEPASAPTPMVGVATGEYQNGVPVYRLPPVTVTVSRSAELAKMAREDAVAMSAR